MKKLFFSAALAMFALTAIAQTETRSKSDVSVTAKTKKKDKEKGTEISGAAKSRSDVEFRQDDSRKDEKLSAEEKASRKNARKEEMRSRKADRDDDGLLNGSATENNIHGKAVSEIATGTTLEGSEKGAAISDVAKGNLNGEVHREGATRDGKMTPEEKTARKEEVKTRKADRADDGLLNGSVDKNVRGKAAGGIGAGTSVRGKAKGVEVSTGARTKTTVGTGIDISAGKKTRTGK